MEISTHLRLESWRSGDASVVSAHGDIDLATCIDAEAALAAAREGPGAVVLDLRRVGFMDTSALRLVFEERRRAREHGYRFAVVRGSSHVQRLFEIVGLPTSDTLFVDDPTEVADGVA